MATQVARKGDMGSGLKARAAEEAAAKWHWPGHVARRTLDFVFWNLDS